MYALSRDNFRWPISDPNWEIKSDEPCPAVASPFLSPDVIIMFGLQEFEYDRKLSESYKPIHYRLAPATAL